MKGEKIVLWLAAAAGVGVSVSHTLGIFDGKSWITEHLPTLTLLLVAGLLPLLAHIIESIRSLTEEVQYKVEGLDPILRLIFEEQIVDHLSCLDDAFRRRQVKLYDVDLFRHFYRRTLDKLGKTTMYATSLPLPSYFWKNEQILNDMKKFIDRGGKILRVFFLTDWGQQDEREARKILEAQVGIGVEVYCTNAREIPAHLKKLFLVEAGERIAWQVSVGPSHEITEVVATSDPRQAKQLAREFKEILESGATRRFRLAAHKAAGATGNARHRQIARS